MDKAVPADAYDSKYCQGRLGLHPAKHFDENTVTDIKVAMTEIANTQTRQEIRKFWILRRYCPLCQAALTYDADVFADAVATLYDLLARKDEAFSVMHHNAVVGWATLLFDIHKAGKASELEALEGSDLLEEVCHLAKVMLIPASKQLLQDILECVEDWDKKGTVLEEWKNLLERDNTFKMLEQELEDVTSFSEFLSSVATKLKQKHPTFLAILEKRDDLLGRCAESENIATAMGARLLLKSRFPGRYASMFFISEGKPLC